MILLIRNNWLELIGMQNISNPDVKIVESGEDGQLDEEGHVPGAVKVLWFTTLQHPFRRDFLSKWAFKQLCSDLGIENTTEILYSGDESNRFTCYAFWPFEYYGNQILRIIMNGGRLKWVQEEGPLTIEIPTYPKTVYEVKKTDERTCLSRGCVLPSGVNSSTCKCTFVPGVSSRVTAYA